jgi:hypothetical protein
MNLNMDPNLMYGLIIVLVLLAIATFMHFRRHQSHVLEKRFGPEYERAVDTLGSRPKAEAELKARQKRVEKLQLVPLSAVDAQRFRGQWQALQLRFVDDPRGALDQADQLVGELMQKRGYPMADFELSAADISVDHPQVVGHYRAAHEIALQNQRGEADTEEIRQAVVHYRALFADLLEIEEPQQRATTPNGMRTPS